MRYRAEIDGLRALAVVPVILFHAGFELFSGGFVGVDVFFVISGYLITTTLIEDIESNRFSLLNFYERRARRILPALFFVMLVCIPFAWMWMLASQMKDFSQSLAAVSLFASNILFWHESGYFDTAAEEKPLLHTWSLAVEEQYYVLFPIFLFLAWRYGKNRVFWVIVVMALISLLLSEWGWRSKAIANFYLAPTRAWELFAGSIAAFVIQKRGVQKNNALSLVGLAAIIFAILAYDETTPFPSVYALVPVVGVVLLVLFADKETLAARILSTKAFVGIGLISYSAYLWHQPLFAFARIRLLDEPSELLMAILSASSLGLAVASWKYIETPFRQRALISRRGVFAFSALGMIWFIGLGFYGHKQDGFGVERTLPVHQSSVDTSSKIASPVYVVGDSHAGHLLEGIEAFSSNTLSNMSSSGCIPFRNVDRYDSRFESGACARTSNSYLDALNDLNQKSVVIISSMGPVYLDGTPFNGKHAARVTGLRVELINNPNITDHYEIFEIGMRETLRELSNNENLEIIFTLDVPELGIDHGCQPVGKELSILGFALTDLIEPFIVTDCYVTRAVYEGRSKRYRDLVQSVLLDFPNVHFFDPTPYFCDNSKCHGFLENIGYLYRDADHLSSYGSRYYVEQLISEFGFLTGE